MDLVAIDFATDLYNKTLELRNNYLRKPIGLTLSEADTQNEDKQLHFGVMIEQQLIACAVIKPVDTRIAKLRQMLVIPAFQGAGVGRFLVRQIEHSITQYGFEEVHANARISASEFYRKLGYFQQGLPFIEVGIPHIMMMKIIQQRDLAQ
jgi:predicted GNAT family N-acyltransferase